MNLNPSNILVINFGQLGDVVLSLPALSGIRQRFPRSRITVAVSTLAAEVVELANCADNVLKVDRVALRDGPKLISIFKMARFIRQVRRERFDFVIDLHSLSETNLLGYLSGAKLRLFARRKGRSLDYLSNFHPLPPVEDRTRHAVECYLETISPLGITVTDTVPRIRTRASDDSHIEQRLSKERIDRPLIGMFPGAGHRDRQWPLERFAELAHSLVNNDTVRVVVVLGPEESHMTKQIRDKFPRETILFDKLNIGRLSSLLARLSVLVTNDTGPMHVAAAVGTPVVALFDRRAPMSYKPVGDNNKVISTHILEELTTDHVYGVTRSALVRTRTTALFTN
jgi:heptosyltransferase I